MENEKIIIDKILDNFKKKYCARYGAAIFEINGKKTSGGIELTGKVLIESQKNDIVNTIKKSGIKVQGEKIRIIGDPREKLELGWGEIKDGVVDALGRYIPSENATLRAINKFRATQLDEGDTVRVLAEKDGQLLIQAEDLTLGWIKKNQIAKIKSQKSIEKWRQTPVVEKNKLYKVENVKEADINGFIEKFLNIPYLLGGTTKRGIDCSSLVQKIYKDVFNIILPRHSEDQAKCGISIENLTDAQKYDLVFLKLKNNGHHHIGVIVNIGSESVKIKPADIRIFNARRCPGRAIIQDLAEIFKDYELLDIRRIIA